MICTTLVLGTADLPAPLAELSPWLDADHEDAAEVRRLLAAQGHRRVIKTHTPLDGLPLDAGVTYVVVGRHPLDVGISLYHHARNLDRERIAELSGASSGAAPSGPLDAWLRDWVAADPPVEEQLDTLPGLVHHSRDAFARVRSVDVVMVHYDHLVADCEGEMRALADRLGIEVSPPRWPELVEAVSFESMRRQAARLAPDRHGVLRDPAAFFRSGRSGEGRSLLAGADLRRYDQRMSELAEPDLRDWLEHGQVGRVDAGPS